MDFVIKGVTKSCFSVGEFEWLRDTVAGPSISEAHLPSLNFLYKKKLILEHIYYTKAKL